VLDQAATDAYQAAGITEDPRTWRRPAPTLADVVTFLTRPSGHDVAAGDLAARLAPYTTGSYADLFGAGSRGTRLEPESHLVVYGLRDLADELKPLAMLVALDRIWQTVAGPVRRRRLVVVDEAWLLMRDPASAEFLFRLAKSGRKHWAGLSLITQDAADLLATDLGQATVTNAATQILLRQAPQAIETVTAAFGLSAGERQLLLSAPRGHGLLLAGGGDRVAFRSLASATENTLITTDPAELATLD
jgi:type IV secretory pathway VirB4 component